MWRIHLLLFIVRSPSDRTNAHHELNFFPITFFAQFLASKYAINGTTVHGRQKQRQSKCDISSLANYIGHIGHNDHSLSVSTFFFLLHAFFSQLIRARMGTNALHLTWDAVAAFIFDISVCCWFASLYPIFNFIVALTRTVPELCVFVSILSCATLTHTAR